MHGVLVSWAVPKGIPEDLTSKRLAVHVEDHPLDYRKFEGTIPRGNYGAGTVSLWDSGDWNPLDEEWAAWFDKGKLKFFLRGSRLHGAYLLARMKEEPNWLLRKLPDGIQGQESHTRPRETATFVPPQLARLTASVPEGDTWWHELKLDGYRIIAVKEGGRVMLFTRNGIDWTDRFQPLSNRLGTLSKDDFVIDGEVVVFDQSGRSRFGELQAALQGRQGDKISFVAFDLLHLAGQNLRDLPLTQRVAELAKLIKATSGRIRRSEVWRGRAGRPLFRQACEHGLEGIISKNSAGRYLPGRRADWLKFKCRARQEFIICGYTEPQGSLRGFGAILLASLEDGKLIARGKVGTGFSDRDRVRLLRRFESLRVPRRVLPRGEPGVTWIEPELVAEIEFAEITRDGLIRQGSFIALREDKNPSQVQLDSTPRKGTHGNNMNVHGITITHPDRMVYPTDDLTKLDVVRYYERIGHWLLPHVANRPLSILRAPTGITGAMFFQKSFSSHTPPHVTQKELPDGTSIFFVTQVRGLISLAQFGTIEFHPWGSRLPRFDKPDMLIWDLDPDSSVEWPLVQGAALLLRDVLADFGLRTSIKTSGGKGLHIVLFLKRTHEWDVMRDFSKAVAREVASRNPSRLVITSSKAKRKGKIFIDWMRNGEGSTCIAPWSLRAREGATVSMPFNWQELENVTANGFASHDPLTPPSDWLDPKPQFISKALLQRLT